ncbi:hypothetical protein DVQ20_09815 [Yersinia enterocolitica]|nr:hypothetical protein [Yersinia enterocolitica]
MRIDSMHRLFLLIYLAATYAVVIPVIYIIQDLIIGGTLFDILNGHYSFIELLAYRKITCFNFSAVGGLVGLICWLVINRKN